MLLYIPLVWHLFGRNMHRANGGSCALFISCYSEMAGWLAARCVVQSTFSVIKIVEGKLGGRSVCVCVTRKITCFCGPWRFLNCLGETKRTKE